MLHGKALFRLPIELRLFFFLPTLTLGAYYRELSKFQTILGHLKKRHQRWHQKGLDPQRLALKREKQDANQGI